jgi:hypothetical protein
MKGDLTRSTWDRQKHYSSVRQQQGRVQVDADWNEQADIEQHLRQEGARDVIGPCGAPVEGGGFQIGIAAGGTDLTISAGHLWVDGILCEAEPGLSYLAQPDLPQAPPLSTLSAGAYLVYADVWRRHITALEDPSIRETALGGPDTATRAKTVAQVKLLRVGGAGGTATCTTNFPAFTAATAPSSGLLRARTQPGSTPPDPCIVPAQAGYTRLENQLYRVEIHEVRPDGTATFKWSRNNGFLVTEWEAQNGDELTVRNTGPDSVTGFQDAQWVELTDDTRELQGLPGRLVRVLRVEGQIIEIDDGGTPVDRADFPLNPKVRRWDLPAAASGPLSVETPAANGGYLALENGIEIRFEAGAVRTGDYWLIPARAFVGEFAGEIEWPQEAPNQGVARPPEGIRHHACRLGLVSVSGNRFTGTPTDCRPLFPALTRLTRFYKVGGEGQEARPGRPLPCPLAVAVSNGDTPVAGAPVRFQVPAGSGTLSDGAQSGVSLTVLTDAGGVALCQWTLPSATAVDDDQNPVCLTTTATLLAGVQGAALPPLRFSAQLSEARQVAYDPANCPPLAEAGADTVQQAIDVLCQNLGGNEPGITVQAVRVLDDDIFIGNDSPLAADQLARGVMILCDQDLDPEAFSQPSTDFAVPAKPNCTITLDLPYPLGSDSGFWDFNGIVGFQPLVLRATVQAEGNRILWLPHSSTQDWLQSILFNRLTNNQITNRVLCHLRLRGNFIWNAGAGTGERPKLYLDGEAFGFPAGDHVGLTLPSGDLRRGGDFEMWFWLDEGGAPPGPRRGLVLEPRVRGNDLAVRILDETGSPLPGTTLVVTSGRAFTRSSLTDVRGVATFLQLPSGRYRITAQLGSETATADVSIPATPTPPLPRFTLADVPGVGAVSVGRLEAAGITSVEALAELDEARLGQILNLSPTRALVIREAARTLLRTPPG